MPKPEDKPLAIPKQLVWEAWQRVKANDGAPGVASSACRSGDRGLAAFVFGVVVEEFERVFPVRLESLNEFVVGGRGLAFVHFGFVAGFR